MPKHDSHSDLNYRRCQSGLERLATASEWSPVQVRWHSRRLLQHHRDLRRLMALVENGNCPKARRLQDHILNSFSGALCATLETLAAKWGKDGPLAMSVDELGKMVRSARPTRRIFGHAVVKLSPKSDGSNRITLSPDWKVRTAQLLVSRVLACWSLESPHDYNLKGPA